MGDRLSSPTFAGREAELDELCGTFRALDTSGARTVLVGGEAGIGKTRLIDEFRSRARAAGGVVAAGVCVPTDGGGLPYGPVVGVLRDLSRQLDASTAEAVLAPARVGLGLDATVAPDLAFPHEMGKTRLFEALLDGFTALTERSRVVLVFEDMHWADSASVEVVDFLARNLGDRPLLLVGTYRSDELDRDPPLRRMLIELGRHRAVSQFELSALDRDATAALMAGILGRQPEWALLDAVHGRSAGNPFFAEELTAARDATSLPSALRNVIMLRVDRLTAAAREVVAIVATAGGAIDHRLLAAVCDLEPEALSVAAAEAVALQVLAVDDQSRFRFRHQLQRDAVDATLMPTERMRLHRRLALALTANAELRASGPGHAAVQLSNHWWEAREWSEALPAAITAGDAMAALLAIPESFVQYERAVAACDHLPAEAGRATIDYGALLVNAADVAYLTGAAERSLELLDAAVAAIDADTDPRRAAVAHTKRGRTLWANGDGDAAFTEYQLAVALLPADEPSVELAGALAEEARGLMLVARVTEGEARAREAIAIARAVGARTEEGHAICTLGCCVAELGDYETGIAYVRDSIVIAEEVGQPDLLERAYGNLSHNLLSAGRLDEAAAMVFAGMGEGERLVGVRLNGAGQETAEALIRLGRWTEAEDLLGRMDERGVGSCVFGPQAVRAMLATRRGRFGEASERLVAADELSAGLRTVQVRGWFHLLRAELALEEAHPALAFEEIEHALSVAAGTDDHTFRPEMCAIGIRALADEHDEARARGRRVDGDKFRTVAADLVEQAERHVLLPQQAPASRPPRMRALLSLCRAEASRLLAPDPDAWRDTAREWDEASEPYPAAYCRWREAEATLATRGGTARATDAARAAWEAAAEIGAPLLTARVERLAQRARLALTTKSEPEKSPQRRIGEDLGLTPREVDVLVQLARGRTDRQIAEELFISKKTASVHVSNILRKLDATNRVEAAEIGQRAGLDEVASDNG